MPLGKGLSSLIPKKDVNQPQPQAEDFATSKIMNEPSASIQGVADAFRTVSNVEENFSSPKPAQASGHGSADKKIPQDAIFQIEVDKIKPNPQQPRRYFDEATLKELAASIQEFGVLQPLVVSKIEKENEMGTSVEYELIAGERRLMAAKLLGWERVPAIVRKISQKSEQLELAVLENLQRENLNSIETARAYAKLQEEFGITQREIASRLGKSRETVANTLRLLNLPTEIQDAVAKNHINESQARLLLAIEEPAAQKNLFNELLNNNLSVRELRQRVRKTSDKIQEANDKPAMTADPETSIFQEKLIELLSAPVKIEKSGDGGKIIITYYSPEEIQSIIDKLHPSS